MIGQYIIMRRPTSAKKKNFKTARTWRTVVIFYFFSNVLKIKTPRYCLTCVDLWPRRDIWRQNGTGSVSVKRTAGTRNPIADGFVREWQLYPAAIIADKRRLRRRLLERKSDGFPSDGRRKTDEDLEKTNGRTARRRSEDRMRRPTVHPPCP